MIVYDMLDAAHATIVTASAGVSLDAPFADMHDLTSMLSCIAPIKLWFRQPATLIPSLEECLLTE